MGIGKRRIGSGFQGPNRTLVRQNVSYGSAVKHNSFQKKLSSQGQMTSPLIVFAIAFAVIMWATGFSLFQSDSEIANQTYIDLFRKLTLPITFISIFVVLNFLNRNVFASDVTANYHIIFIYIYAILSILYAPIRRQTFDVAWGLCEMTVVVAAFAITAGSPRRMLEFFYILFFAMIILCYAAVVGRPSAGIHIDGIYNMEVEQVIGAWRGVFWHKNTTGIICALAVITAFTFKSRGIFGSSLFRVAFFSISLIFLILSEAKAALGITLLIILLNFAMRKFSKFFQRNWYIFAFPFVFIVFSLSYVDIIYLEPEFEITFSNRTPIWQLHYDYWMLKPILGHGYAGVFLPTGGGISSFGTGWEAMMPHAHNGYLDVLGQLGIIGAGTLCVAILMSIRAGLKLSADPLQSLWARPATLLLIACLLTGLMEAVIMSQRFVWCFAVIVMLLLNGSYARARL